MIHRRKAKVLVENETGVVCTLYLYLYFGHIAMENFVICIRNAGWYLYLLLRYIAMENFVICIRDAVWPLV